MRRRRGDRARRSADHTPCANDGARQASGTAAEQFAVRGDQSSSFGCSEPIGSGRFGASCVCCPSDGEHRILES